MAIYDNSFIVAFSKWEEARFSSFSPYNQGSIRTSTSYVVKDEDTLFSIAAEHYEDTRFWYLIAEWNNLVNFLDLETGVTLKLPNFE